MLYIQIGHSQLSSVYWLPVVLLLVLKTLHGRHPGRYAFLTGLLVGLLFLSTYYVPWFAAISTVLWLVVTGVLRFAAGPGRAGAASPP